MILPTIHLNGTSVRSLLDDNSRAYTALMEAIQYLAQTAPNGRDYYPQGDIDGKPALYVAQDQHSERMAMLLQVKRELEAIGEYLASEELRRKR